MKVVAHEHVGVNPDLVNPGGCLQLIEKDRSIPVIGEDILSFVPPAGDSIFYVRRPVNVKSKDLTPVTRDPVTPGFDCRQ
jgi:hypothetical protein